RPAPRIGRLARRIDSGLHARADLQENGIALGLGLEITEKSEGRMVRIGVEDVSRRGFLKGMLGAGAFVLSVRLMPTEVVAAGVAEEMATGGLKGPLSPNVWLAIDTDGLVYIIAHRSEMGSGSRTGVPIIAADELDADWKKVRLVQATGDEKY